MRDEISTGVALLFDGQFRVDDAGCWIWTWDYAGQSNRWPKAYVTEKTGDYEQYEPGKWRWFWDERRPHHAACSVRRYVCMAKYGDTYPLGDRESPFAMCGDARCINPDHLVVKRLDERFAPAARVPVPRAPRARRRSSANDTLIIGGVVYAGGRRIAEDAPACAFAAD